jgi:arylsulfatase A-like enzyme
MTRAARWRVSLALLGLGALAAGGIAVTRGLRRPATEVERLFDHPERLRFTGTPAPSAPRAAGTRWSAEDIAREWEVDDTHPARLRSPALDLAGDLDAVVVSLAPARGTRAVLLWSAERTPSAADRARNAHELTPDADRPLLAAVRGARMADVPFAPGVPPPRHLFLEGADGNALRALVRAVEVVRVQDRLLEGAGRLRAAVAGEIRPLLHTPVPGEAVYTTALAGEADLVLGVAVRGTTGPATVTVEATSGRRTRTLIERAVLAGAAWADLRLPLRARGRVALTLRARAAGPGGTVLWGSPMIVPRAGAAGAPSIIVYLVDALRPDHLGFQGYGKPTSPFLDALAARSLVFRRCYAGAAWTKPSVATLITSLHPQTHGVGARSYGDTLPEGVPTLPGILARHGYVTALFSANPLGGAASGLDQHFDRTFTPAALAGGRPGAKVRSADLQAPLLAWLEAHAEDRSFAFVHAVDTHPPYAAGGSEVDAYDAEVKASDAALGALYARLEARGLARRTLLVVTADHGRALGERGQSGHGLSVREEQVRVPLLLHQPGAVEPRTVEHPVHLVDVLPTVLARCGIDAPAGAQGRTLTAAEAPRPVFVSRFVFPEDRAAGAGHGPEQVAMVDHPWKLIVTETAPPGPPRMELFDLRADAAEREDLAARETGRVRRMSAELLAFLRRQQEARRALAAAGGAAAPSSEMLEQLRALGYAR